MKKIMKILSLLLCFTMAFSMVGCGNKNTGSDGDAGKQGTVLDFADETGSGINTDGNSGSNNSNAGVGSNTIKADGSDKVIFNSADPFANIPKNLRGSTVTFAHFGDEGADQYKKVIAAFTKRTGIKVELVIYDQDTYMSTVAKQITAKSGPDVIICNEIFPYGLEVAQPLQNLVDLKDNFWSEQITDMTTIGGNTYFVNSYSSVWQNVDMVFYNPKIFSENRITSPRQYFEKGQWTYENLRKCLEAVAKVDGLDGGYVEPYGMAASLGASPISYDAKTKTFSQNLKAATPAFVYCSENIQNKLWDPVRWFGQFSTGEIGLYVQTAYGAKYNGWFRDCDSSMLDAVPVPTSYQGKATKQSATLRCYGIAKGAKNPQGAAYFLRYFLDYAYYEDSGAKVFINDKLKKVYFDEVMARAKKEGINYTFQSSSRYAANADSLKTVAEVSPNQVSGKLESYINTYDEAVRVLNGKIKDFS